MRAIAVAAGIVLALTLPVQAGDLRLGSGPVSRTETFRRQGQVIDVIDSRPARQYSAAADEKTAPNPRFDGGYDGGYDGRYLSVARAAAQRHRVPEALFLRLVT